MIEEQPIDIRNQENVISISEPKLNQIKKRWKILLISAVFLILILLIVLITFAKNNMTNHESIIQQGPSKASTSTKAGASLYTSSVKTYDTANYSFSYPAGSVVQSKKVVGGGSIITIIPEGVSANEPYPQLVIESDPFSQKLLEQKNAFLTALGLQKSEITLGSVEATKYSGTIKFILKGPNGYLPLQDTALIEKVGNTLYQIEYSYIDATIDPNLESYFSSIISTIVMHQ